MVDIQFNDEEIQEMQANYNISDEDLETLLNFIRDYAKCNCEYLNEASFRFSYYKEDGTARFYFNNREDEDLPYDIVDIIKKYKFFYAIVTTYSEDKDNSVSFWEMAESLGFETPFMY